MSYTFDYVVIDILFATNIDYHINNKFRILSCPANTVMLTELPLKTIYTMLMIFSLYRAYLIFFNFYFILFIYKSEHGFFP